MVFSNYCRFPFRVLDASETGLIGGGIVKLDARKNEFLGCGLSLKRLLNKYFMKVVTCHS